MLKVNRGDRGILPDDSIEYVRRVSIEYREGKKGEASYATVRVEAMG
jgi:hypothetical protein